MKRKGERADQAEKSAEGPETIGPPSLGNAVATSNTVLGYGTTGSMAVYYENTACACGGENSHCYKCDGTGYYRAEFILNKGQTSARRVVVKAPEVSLSKDSRGDSFSVREGGRFASAPIEDDYDN